jgi:GntP family gluconate:H+ symporter
MTPDQGYKTQTTATLIEGVCGMAGVFILSLILR